MSTVWSGGERGGKAPSANLRLRANEIGPRDVIRRFGRRLAEFSHAVDWGYVRFVLAWVATLGVLLHIAGGRGL